MAEQPKYVESLRGEIAVLDRKIEDFNGKFDQKFDQKVETLSGDLHRLDNSLIEVSTKLESFIQRVDKFVDRVWGLFVACLFLLLASIGTAATSIWQVQQHGKQLDRLEKSVEKIVGLETAITRLDGSVAKIPNFEQQIGRLERSIEKIAGLQTAITRLDESVAKIPNLEQQVGRLEKSVEKITGLEATIVRLDRSLAQHGKQLDRLEKSAEKIAGLENAITRLDASVVRLTNLERTLPDLAGSIRENLALSRTLQQRLTSIDKLRDELHQVAVLAPPIRRLRQPLDSSHMQHPAQPKQLAFEWQLSPDLSKGIVAGTKALTVLPEDDPAFRGKDIRTTTEVRSRPGLVIIGLSIDFPTIDAAQDARQRLADHPGEAEIFVVVGPGR